MTCKTASRPQSEGGFALVIVLSFLLIAATVTTPFLISARLDALVSRNNGQTTRDKILLTGLTKVAALRYFERTQTSLRARHISCALDPATITFSIQDHSGLIDLNAASPEVLSVGFASLGLAPGIAATLANHVVEYRSLAPATPPASPARNGYKHAWFEHVSELQDLMVPAFPTAKHVDEVFTVHSGTGTVDRAAASPRLLAALELVSPLERYFLVNDTRRTNAITITATLRREKHPLVVSHATLGPGRTSASVQFIGPLILDKSHQPITNTPQDSIMDCKNFFDPNLLALVQEVTS